MARWSNKGSTAVRGKHPRSNPTCPYCNLRYRNFRMSISMSDVYNSVRQEHENGKRHHYTLRTVLGKAHQLKMVEWGEHLAMCEVYEALVKCVE